MLPTLRVKARPPCRLTLAGLLSTDRLYFAFHRANLAITGHFRRNMYKKKPEKIINVSTA